MAIIFYLTTGVKFLENIAIALTENWRKKVYVKNNALKFPVDKATGRFEFYNIEDGVSICLLDCSFAEEVHFVKAALPINDFYFIQFNIGSSLGYIRKGESIIGVGGDWKNAIIWSSSETVTEYKICPGARIKTGWVICTRNWLMEYYPFSEQEVSAKICDLLNNRLSEDVLSDINLQALLLAEELFLLNEKNADQYSLYVKGCLKRFISLAVNNAIPPLPPVTELEFQEVLKVIQVKQQLEHNLSMPLPLMESLAAKCAVTKTKFMLLFKNIYKKGCNDFFIEAKMQRAAELIIKGVAINEVGHAVGYTNLGYFAKVFKDYFHISPKMYGQKNYKLKIKE